MMNQHTSKQFDSELEQMRTRALQMGGLVEQQIDRAVRGLESGDMGEIEDVIATDKTVNRFEIELDQLCSHIIARRQPTAVDLRMVMSVVRIVRDLERVGDEAKKIAKMARSLHSEEGGGFIPDVTVRHAADLAVKMLRESLDAFARADLELATSVVRQDKAVDAEFKALMRQLITYMMEDPRTISRCIELLFVAKAIERIGDHAKNMAQYAVYMAKGEDVRHAGIEAMERAVRQ